MENTFIRTAQIGDIPAMAGLEKETFGADGYSTEVLLRFLERFPDFSFVCIGPADKVMGYSVGGGRGNPNHDIETAGWVNSLVVDLQFRRHGLGTLLLD